MTEGVPRRRPPEQSAAWIFFVGYILISTFVVLNLFIAVVVSAMEENIPGRSPAAEPAESAVLAEVRALRAEVRALCTGSDDGPPS